MVHTKIEYADQKCFTAFDIERRNKNWSNYERSENH